MAIDAVVVAAAFVLSYYLRKFLPAGLFPLRLGPIDHYLWILLATIPIWWLLLFLNGAYRPRVESPAAIIRLALKVGAGGLLILALLLFLIKFETFNRSLLVLFVFVETGMLIATRLAVSSWLALRRRAGKSTRRALIVAADEPDSRLQTAFLLEGMQKNHAEGVVPIGFLTLGIAAQASPRGEIGRASCRERV